MQKPSKLAQIPQIRFAGFTEDWERRKLGITKTFLQMATMESHIQRHQIWPIAVKVFRFLQVVI
ncbi:MULTISPECIES: hypothetical protein [Campylobacter]|uniref:Restriction endonuclease subunit S n=1 Tax=Campylobacter vicugnae TaxID=1660076 RepID=A0ABZ2E8A3_9BACT|nr:MULTISPECIES: hypothetical protein [unclassified Campylobacter]MCR8690813.1 hypothetical protein [Campylobacter sp. RM9264]MCR8701851.1 hypothetical protein [Campylobacter sp. RM12176]